MREITQQIKVHVQGSSKTQLISMLVGVALLFAAVLLGGFKIIQEASEEPHGHEEWWFVGGCGLGGLLCIIGPEPIVKIIVAINPLKRNGDKA